MSTYKIPSINYIKPQLADLGWVGDVRFDPDDSAPLYIGLHVTNGAPTDAEDWKIYKFSYSGANVTRVQLSYGTWDGRVALFP